MNIRRQRQKANNELKAKNCQKLPKDRHFAAAALSRSRISNFQNRSRDGDTSLVIARSQANDCIVCMG